jgi:site-specific recombinase XerC
VSFAHEPCGPRLTSDVTSNKSLRDRAMFAVLLGCGLRRTELANLTLWPGISEAYEKTMRDLLKLWATPTTSQSSSAPTFDP